MSVVRTFAGTAAGLAVVLFSTAGAFAATNLVANPSGSGGATTGWIMNFNGTNSSLSAVQRNGDWWLHYTSTQYESIGDWVFYNITVQPGQTYTCGFVATGSGVIHADAWNNTVDTTSASKALSSTPQTFMVTFPAGPKTSDQMQVRFTQPPVSVYFNEVTCAPGNTVTLASAAAAAPSATALPKTGAGAGLEAGGLGAVAAGILLAIWDTRKRYRRARA